MKRTKFRSAQVNFLSAVDHPAQTPALATAILKRITPADKSPEPDMKTTEQFAKKLADTHALTPEEFAIYKTCATEDAQDAYLARTPADRATEVAKARAAAQVEDPVVVEVDGVQYRKSAGEATIALAKSLKASQAKQAVAEGIAKARILKGRVDAELQHLPGTDEHKIALLEAIETHVTEPTALDGITKMLHAQNVALGAATQRTGVGGGLRVVGKSAESAADKLQKSVDELRAKTPGMSIGVAYSKVLASDAGKALEQEVLAEQAEARDAARGR